MFEAEKKFTVMCKGRDRNGDEVLENPESVEVHIWQETPGADYLSLSVTCPHQMWGSMHNNKVLSQRCKASGSRTSNKGYCPFALSLPGSIDSFHQKAEKALARSRRRAAEAVSMPMP